MWVMELTRVGRRVDAAEAARRRIAAERCAEADRDRWQHAEVVAAQIGPLLARSASRRAQRAGPVAGMTDTGGPRSRLTNAVTGHE